MAKRTTKQNAFTRLNLKLKEILPLTHNQHKLFDAYATGAHMFITGCPGTGKSFLSIYNALTEMVKGKYKHLVIMRSVVPSRDIGFLPGTAEEKAAIYEQPYIAIMAELFGRADAYELLKKEGVIEFSTTSFLRGTTFKDSIVVFDECQNENFNGLNTVITRIGNSSKMIICGDYYQTDLYKNNRDLSGFIKFREILKMVNGIEFLEMGVDDIVRGKLVKEWIVARMKWESEHEVLHRV